MNTSISSARTCINFSKLPNALVLDNNAAVLGENGLNALLSNTVDPKSLEQVFFCAIAPQHVKPLNAYISSFSRSEERDFLNDYVQWRTHEKADDFSYSPLRIESALHHLEKVDAFLTYVY